MKIIQKILLRIEIKKRKAKHNNIKKTKETLLVLGFKKNEIEKLMKNINKNLTHKEMVKQALRG